MSASACLESEIQRLYQAGLSQESKVKVYFSASDSLSVAIWLVLMQWTSSAWDWQIMGNVQNYLSQLRRDAHMYRISCFITPQ